VKVIDDGTGRVLSRGREHIFPDGKIPAGSDDAEHIARFFFSPPAGIYCESAGVRFFADGRMLRSGEVGRSNLAVRNAVFGRFELLVRAMTAGCHARR
jgi:hypothetical protein